MNRWVLCVREQYGEIVELAKTLKTPLNIEDIKKLEAIAKIDSWNNPIIYFQENSSEDKAFRNDDRYVRMGGH